MKRGEIWHNAACKEILGNLSNIRLERYTWNKLPACYTRWAALQVLRCRINKFQNLKSHVHGAMRLHSVLFGTFCKSQWCAHKMDCGWGRTCPYMVSQRDLRTTRMRRSRREVEECIFCSRSAFTGHYSQIYSHFRACFAF